MLLRLGPAEGVRDDRLREDVDLRTRCPATRISARRRRMDDESRPSRVRRKAAGAEAREGWISRRRAAGRLFRSAATPMRATLDLGVHLAWRAGRISDHDALIGRKLSWILSGGSLPHAGKVSEDQLAGSRARGVSQPVRRAEDARAHPAHAEDRQDVEKLDDEPLVLIPGIQGRWEWMQPAVDELAKDGASFRARFRASRAADTGLERQISIRSSITWTVFSMPPPLSAQSSAACRSAG